MGRRGGTAGLRASLAVASLGVVLVAVVWWLMEEDAEPGARPGLPTPPVAADEPSLPERALVGDEPAPLAPANDAPVMLHEGPPAPGPPVYSGHVAGPDEQPVVGARIRLHPSGSGDWQERQPLAETRTAADGSFRLELPARPDGPLLAYAEADGHLARSMSPIEPGQPLSITLGWVARAYGTVRDAETGAPIEGARVSSMRGADVLSAADGTYAIDGVVVGQENRVRAEHPDYVASAELFHVRTRGPVQVDLQLAPGVALEIPVVDRVTGAPLPGAAFRYALEGAPFAYADDAGRYATRVSAGSEHHLYVTHEGYASLHWIWEVTDPDARHPPTVPLLPLSSIVGRVEDAEGRPLEGVSVFAANERGGGSIAEVPEEVREAHGLTGRARERASSSASTDADGRFVLEVLSLESPYTLTANREGLAPCRSSPVPRCISSSTSGARRASPTIRAGRSASMRPPANPGRHSAGESMTTCRSDRTNDLETIRTRSSSVPP